MARALCRLSRVEGDFYPVVSANVLVDFEYGVFGKELAVRRALRGECIAELLVERVAVVFFVDQAV